MKILMLFLLSLNLFAMDYYKQSLVDFTSFVSKSTHKNIYIDEDINTTVSLFVPVQFNSKNLFEVYTKTVRKHGFDIELENDIYYLVNKHINKPHTRIYNLKYNSFPDIKSFLDLLSIKYKYLRDTNTILFRTDYDTYIYLKDKIALVDIPKKQVYLKIMIFELNDNKLRDVGIQYGSIYKDITSTTQNALNSIIATINTTSKPIHSFDFYSAIKLLQENDLLSVKQNPYVLSKHNKDFSFDAVTNIPYLVTSTKTDASNTSEQTTHEYKDVGLKIKGKTFIYDDYVSLDIDLKIEDILSGGETPTTFKRSLKSSADVKYNDVLILSGIKKEKTITNDYSIPYLSNIPYLGELFKYKTNSKEDTRITIAIQVLRDLNVGEHASELVLSVAKKSSGAGRPLSN